MQRFRNILFISDPITRAMPALQRAVELARSNDAKLTVCQVHEELPVTLRKLQKEFVHIHNEELLELLKKIPTDDLTVKTLPLLGLPFLEIIKTVTRYKFDLVIKPTERYGNVAGKMLFGSTDLHLLRKCPCPVWIIKPSPKKSFSRILATVDPDPSEASNAGLNTLILDLATSLAARENSQLSIVHAWYLSHESDLRCGRTPIAKSELGLMLRDMRKIHKRWLDELLNDYDLSHLSANVHLLKGNPGDIIVQQAEKKQVDLIVMGTVARTGIPGFFIGNTAEKVLTEVNCSVLAVKPEAFCSPVHS